MCLYNGLEASFCIFLTVNKSHQKSILILFYSSVHGSKFEYLQYHRKSIFFFYLYSFRESATESKLSFFQGCPNHSHTVTHSHLEAAQYNNRLICGHRAAPLEQIELGALLKGHQRWNMGGASNSLYFHHPNQFCWSGV